MAVTVTVALCLGLVEGVAGASSRQTAEKYHRQNGKSAKYHITYALYMYDA
jgi:hypothetical protein